MAENRAELTDPQVDILLGYVRDDKGVKPFDVKNYVSFVGGLIEPENIGSTQDPYRPVLDRKAIELNPAVASESELDILNVFIKEELLNDIDDEDAEAFMQLTRSCYEFTIGESFKPEEAKTFFMNIVSKIKELKTNESSYESDSVYDTSSETSRSDDDDTMTIFSSDEEGLSECENNNVQNQTSYPPTLCQSELTPEQIIAKTKQFIRSLRIQSGILYGYALCSIYTNDIEEYHEKSLSLHMLANRLDEALKATTKSESQQSGKGLMAIYLSPLKVLAI